MTPFTAEVPTTWNTWDVRCLNAVVKLPELAEVRIVVYDDQKRTLHDELRWESLVFLGPHSVSGDFSEVTLRHREAVFTLTFAAEGERFVYKITPVRQAAYLRFFIAGLLRWNRPGTIANTDGGFELAGSDFAHAVSVLGPRDHTPINTTFQGVLCRGDSPIYIRGNHDMDPDAMEAFITRKRDGWEREALGGDGPGTAANAMVRGVVWNTIYEPMKDRICTPVTREWCIVRPERPWFGSYVLFIWDTCFNALLAAGQDESLAYAQIASLLQGMTNGMVPMVDSEINVYDDRSQPPVGAYVVLKLYQQHGRLEFLEGTFADLLSWHRWWLRRRDGNGDGLLEWGTDLPVTHDDYNGYLNVAKCESGLDNSPMYDDTRFNPDTHTMELTDVGLNALYALDAWALSEIAAVLGAPEAAELKESYRQLRQRIQAELWNEELGIYCNKHWDGRFSTTLSPTNFYPMLAGIATAAQCEQMIGRHLLNEAEFWGEFVLPTCPRNHPAFADNDYWRGRIWAPTNFLVYEGLRRSGYDDLATEVAAKSLKLFQLEWESESHIHENYNATNGDGDDVANADPVYTWGGLLAYIALNELIFVEPTGGLTLGSPRMGTGELFNFHAHGSRYTISQDEGLTVRQDDVLLLQSTRPLRLTHFPPRGGSWRLNIRHSEPGQLTLYPPDGVTSVTIAYGGQVQELPCRPGQKLLLDVPAVTTAQTTP
jgi:hypothetical protein